MNAPDEPQTEPGYLTARLLQFVQLLRAAGISISTLQVTDLTEALTHIDVQRRDDFYHACRSILVHSPDQRELFDRLFELFWLRRSQWYMGVGRGQELSPDTTSRRKEEEAQQGDQQRRHRVYTDEPPEVDSEPSVEDLHVLATYSSLEILRQKDFADYTQEDTEAAREFLASLRWTIAERPSRRRARTYRRATHLDLRRSIQRSTRHSGEIIQLSWRKRKRRPRPLVVICDISGSMERYTHLFLYLMFGLVQNTASIETFVFGTRLTRITPALRHRDLGEALKETGRQVVDWSGGTRIGESLKSFNYHWARRVLGRGAVAMIISDGWDRGDMDVLEREVSRLHRSVSRLIWLNPLAGRPGYQPLVQGIVTVLPHVDEFLPIHNLKNLEQLADALGTVSA